VFKTDKQITHKEGIGVIMKLNQIIQGDCLEVMKDIPDGSIDMVLTDPPYGKTNCTWDTIVPVKPMWKEIKRIIKPNGAIVMTASQPFTSILIMSNLKMFKYCWVWEKVSAKGHFNAKKMPMTAHEDVVVFYLKQPVYNPQMTHGHIRKMSTKSKSLNSEVYKKNTKTVSYNSTDRYPRSVQIFNQDTQKSSLHPTQKPINLIEYLIKTYTNKGELILDFTAGSGTTAVAAINTHRKYICIERNPKDCKIAEQRISQAQPQLF